MLVSCSSGDRAQRHNNGAQGAEGRAERYRARGVGLRVHGEAGRDQRAGGHVVLQQQSQSRVPVDIGPAAPDHRATQEPDPAGLRGDRGRRPGQVPRAVHKPPDYRADRLLQVRGVHVHGRGLHDQRDDRLR